MELGRAVRNLVPEAPLEDLPLWRLLLDSASSWTPDEQGLLQAYVAELPRHQRIGASSSAWLAERRSPRRTWPGS